MWAAGRCKSLSAMIEDRMTVRITEAELGSDLRAVLARVGKAMR